MKKISRLKIGGLLLFLFFHKISCTETAWNFADSYYAKRFYLHPLVNYEFPIHWYDIAERTQFTGSLFRLNIGSVSLNKLNTEISYRLNRKLNNYLWFRVHFLKEQKQELLTQKNDTLLAFDFILTENFSLFIAANPDFDKSKVNAHAGFMISDSDKVEKYFRLSFERPEFVYDYKNEVGGKTTRSPYQMNWTGRWGAKKSWLYSEGELQSAFIREYPDSDMHVLRYHKLQDSFAFLKWYKQPKEDLLFMFGVTYRDYAETQKQEESEFIYLRRIYLSELRAEYEFFSYLIRPEIHFLHQQSCAKGEKHYSFHRNELLYALFGGYRLHHHLLEIGYLATHFRTSFKEESSQTAKFQEQKALLGWSYYFSENTILRLSVSHVFTILGFGGGNMQFIMHF
jgi:hypothetical protein